jgi:hypothetical protein
MFLSRLPYELNIPAPLKDPGEQLWRLFELAVHVPWFLATLRFTEDGISFQRTFCICWETDVVEVMTATPSATPVALQVVRPSRNSDGVWSVRNIVRIWRLRDSGSNDERSHFALEDDSGACICARGESSRKPDFDGRDVVLDLGTQKRKR